MTEKNATLRVVLFGATELTMMVAQWLLDHGYPLIGIVTTPRQFAISYQPKGVTNQRHYDLVAWGNQQGIAVHGYQDQAALTAWLSELDVNLALVAGWYHMMPHKLRSLFALGCFGFHASLLPQLRGGAPLNWAILQDFKETGVSLFALSDGVDEGELLGQESFPINSTDYIQDLISKSHEAVKCLLASCMPLLALGEVKLTPQRGQPSYCGQRQPEDSCIDWQQPADCIARLVRASSHPYAGAYSDFSGHRFTLWRAKELPDMPVYGMPGQLFKIDDDWVVATGSHPLKLESYTCAVPLKSQMRLSQYPQGVLHV